MGATGEAFEEAANVLSATLQTKPANHIHLPINFLYRHAIELYLKSMIVTVHRSLQIPYGAEPCDGAAFVLSGTDWQPIHRVHSVAILWEHFLRVIRDHETELNAKCNTDWQAIPDGLESSIAEIETMDRSSTFFRYPDRRNPDADQAKSLWKRLETIRLGVAPGEKPTSLFFMLGAEGGIEQGYQYDDAPLAGMSELLKQTAHTLSGAHVGLRVEFANGL